MHRTLGIAALATFLCLFYSLSLHANNTDNKAWKTYWQLRGIMPSTQTDEPPPTGAEAAPAEHTPTGLPVLLPPPGSSPLALIADLAGLEAVSLRKSVIQWLEEKSATVANIEVAELTAPMTGNIPPLGGINSLLPASTQYPKLDTLLETLNANEKKQLPKNPTPPDLLQTFAAPAILQRPIVFVTIYFRKGEPIPQEDEENKDDRHQVTLESLSEDEDDEDLIAVDDRYTPPMEIELTTPSPSVKASKEQEQAARDLYPHIEILVIDDELETQMMGPQRTARWLAAQTTSPVFLGYAGGYMFGIQTPEIIGAPDDYQKLQQENLSKVLALFEELKSQLESDLLLDPGKELQHAFPIPPLTEHRFQSSQKSRLIIIPEPAAEDGRNSVHRKKEEIAPLRAVGVIDGVGSANFIKRQQYVGVGPASSAVDEDTVYQPKGTEIEYSEAELTVTHQAGLWMAVVPKEEPAFWDDAQYSQTLSTSILMTASTPDIQAMQLEPGRQLSHLMSAQSCSTEFFNIIDALLTCQTEKISIVDWQNHVPTILDSLKKVQTSKNTAIPVKGGAATVNQLSSLILGHPLYTGFMADLNLMDTQVTLVKQLAEWRVKARYRAPESFESPTLQWPLPAFVTRLPEIWEQATQTKDHKQLEYILAVISQALSSISAWFIHNTKDLEYLPPATVLPAEIEDLGVFFSRPEVSQFLSRILKSHDPLENLTDELVLTLFLLQQANTSKPLNNESIRLMLATLSKEKKRELLTALVGQAGLESIFETIIFDDSMPRLTYDVHQLMLETKTPIKRALKEGEGATKKDVISKQTAPKIDDQTRQLLSLTDGVDPIDFTRLSVYCSPTSRTQIAIGTGETHFDLENTRLMAAIISGEIQPAQLLTAEDFAPEALIPNWGKYGTDLQESSRVRSISYSGVSLGPKALPSAVQPLSIQNTRFQVSTSRSFMDRKK
ncbi:hypothetical protein [Parendozoicomonas haliclonae]|uniref:Uncharacterized protein n=1 Tax=Parendozoicomonas haliclonae TaxID=1960125 RepID=A0A1X7AKY1_9GAMM|nr:hypothetical protein [Parendozoicomonas haliclonae]SMA48459.1 hypothetical protein EHSB41UT_02748 [Parendozoicomonas haliclonae]